MGALHGKKRSGVRRWLGHVTFALTVVLIGLGAAAVISGSYQVRPVLSGSMRPGLAVGGIVITQRVPISALEVRDVIVFHPPGKSDDLLVHRIIALTPSDAGPVVQTQGDANEIPDPWTVTLQGTSAYRVMFSVPLVGYVAVWAHGPLGRRILFVLGVALVAVAVLGGALRRGRPGGGAARSVHAGSVLGRLRPAGRRRGQRSGAGGS